MQHILSFSALRGSRRYYQQVLRHALVDAILVTVAYGATLSIQSIKDLSAARESMTFIAVTIPVLVASNFFFGVYRRLWERTSGHGITVIVNAVAFSSVVLIAISLLQAQKPLSVADVVVGNLLSLVGFVGVRYRSRVISGLTRRGLAIWKREHPKAKTRVLIIGAGESGQALAWRLKHRFSDHNYLVVGFIDDDAEKLNMFVEGSRVIGNRNDIIRVAEELHIDLIVVAIHNIEGQDFREILTACESTNALIKVVPDLLAMVNATRTTAMLRDVQIEDLLGRNPITRHEAVDLAPVTGKIILITGAAGSIGSELSRQIMNYRPVKAVLLDNNESGLHDLIVEIRAQYPELELVPVLADITIQSTVRAVFAQHQPQIVFHAAAYKHVPMLEYYPSEALRVNICGTRNVAELASAFGVERFVLISTDKAVNPSSIMGATKRVCELMLHAISQERSCKTLFASVRFGNVLGSRGSVVPTFNRQIDNGGPVTVTHQEMTRYFMSIPEAVNLIIHAACMTKSRDIFILQMGEVVRIVELAERMIRLRGLRPYKDIEIRFTGIRPGEKMHEELYHGLETPVETIHPSILQLRSSGTDFDSAQFWTNLNQLVSDPSGEPSVVLARLTELIKPVAEINNNGYVDSGKQIVQK
ncbi:MAG: polysaccharide biosynthesis protein [Anaerolinea sp.]|nr:polysaccharide biosynthesis protein [Anaerolinea sp.]